MLQIRKKGSLTLQAILLVGVLLLMAGCAKGETGSVSAGVSTEDLSFEAEQTKKDAGPSLTAGIEIPGYDALYIDYGTQVMEGDFFNPDENNVYFRIGFWKDEDETAFYQSDLIAPGQHLYQLEMEETFDRGTYDMRIVYETFTTDGSFAPRNGATVSCKLIVE